MIRLLYTELRRFVRSMSFWLMLAMCAGLGVFAGSYSFSTVYGLIPALTVIVVISLVLTPEISEGGMRNKIIAGHKKGAIFCTQVLIGVLLAVLHSLVFCGSLALAASVYFPQKMLLELFCAVLSCTTAFALLFVTVNMLVSNRTLSPILSFMLVVVLVAVGMFLEERLNYPEFYIQYDVGYVDGDYVQLETQVPHELYIGGVQRKIFTFVHDIDPYSHAAGVFWKAQMYYNPYYTPEMIAEEAAVVQYQPLWSLLTCLLVAVIGCLYFRKKDMK